MRKLLATAAAGAAMFLTTTFAGASTDPTVTYSRHQGAYDVCITNPYNGTGANMISEIDFGGFNMQPTSISSPDPTIWGAYAWQQTNGTWTISWNAMPGAGLSDSSSAVCGFSFKLGHKPTRSAEPATLYFYTTYGYFFGTTTVTANYQ
jgi:hypothetical protein